MNLSHLSPGLVGMYWLGASMLTTAAWSTTATLVKRAARRAGQLPEKQPLGVVNEQPQLVTW